jgi:uncharacterized metal-binding protein YceD (DUF177 family)
VTAPEFSRERRLDQIGAGATSVTIAAEPDERAALAARFDLLAIDRLEATCTLRRDATGIRVSGHLSAAVVQRCVVTDAPVHAAVDEAFDLRLLPEPADAAEEVELSADECDTVFYTGAALDLGEAVAETLALALDPYPRSPEAAAVLREAGVISEEEAGPFGALKDLRDRLG